MNNSVENVAKELLSDEKIGKVNANISEIEKMFSTPQGRALISILSKDGGEALRAAVEDAQKGNIDTAKQMIGSLATTKEGREIIRQIIAIAE